MRAMLAVTDGFWERKDIKMKEFFKESKQFKRCMNALINSNFKEWSEIVEYMKDHKEEEYHHENTHIMVYQDDGLYQVCIVETRQNA